MNRLEDLENQNLLDSWASIYISLARKIDEQYGKKGEEIIREGIRRFGRDLGDTIYKYTLETGNRVNIKTIIDFKNRDFLDPRFRENITTLNEEVYIADMITCPLAEFWSSYGDVKLGYLFCEEFYPSFYNTYFNSKSQTNLSKMLTRRGDNMCQFAVYYRKANLDEKQVKDSFIYNKNNESIESNLTLFKSAKEKYKNLWLKIYYYILEVATEVYGDEGQAVISLALQDASNFAIKHTNKRAEMTRNEFNKTFFAKNYAIDYQVLNDEFWKYYDRYNAKKILEVNLSEIIELH